ncbi:MAG: hypothetical protein HQL65_16670 [Magnetococcales bacterium]|nr:hypothetical protein [Magnetococcales bacterium]
MTAILLPFLKVLHIPFSLARRGADNGFGVQDAMAWNWGMSLLVISGSLIALATSHGCLGKTSRRTLLVAGTLYIHLLAMDITCHGWANIWLQRPCNWPGISCFAEKPQPSFSTETQNEDRPDKRKGTYFFGGSGMRGYYLRDFVTAMEETGMTHVRMVNHDSWSQGGLLDAFLVLKNRMRDGVASPLSEFVGQGEQFNLIGISHGGLMAAQVAMDHAESGGKVDHLVLLATPISLEFLAEIRKESRIGSVIVMNWPARGDPIQAGMGLLEILASVPRLVWQYERGVVDIRGEHHGHFYLTGESQSNRDERRQTAKKLFAAGLR